MYLSTFIHVFFFFNDTATTEIYTLSLHDALPICRPLPRVELRYVVTAWTSDHGDRSEEHTSELQSPDHLVCRLLLEKKKVDQRDVGLMLLDRREQLGRGPDLCEHLDTRVFELLCELAGDQSCVVVVVFFFFNDTATTEIYTLSLHDALPI